LEKYNLAGNAQIPEELIQAGGEILVHVIQKLLTVMWNKEELPDQWKESIILPIQKRVTSHTINFI
jgi:hypothetical protein